MIGPDDLLKMRLVSTQWRDYVDEFVGRSHLSASCRWAPTPALINHRRLTFKPVARMVLPLTGREAERFNEMAKHKSCPLIGGRLEIFLDKIPTTTKAMSFSIIKSKAKDLKEVWQHVKHLIVNCRRGAVGLTEFLKRYRGPQGLCAPFLALMTNLKTIVLHLDELDVDLINCLPNPEKLEGICVRSRELEKDGSDDWTQVLSKCNMTLKVLQCDVLTKGMEQALTGGDIVFEQLEEFRTMVHHYTFYQDGSFEADPDYDGPSDEDFLENFARERMKQHFPRLERIGVPFVHKMWDGDWTEAFLLQLADMSNVLDTLQVIEITVDAFLPPLKLLDFPVPRDLYGYGSRNVKKLIVNHYYSLDTANWLGIVARVWPCAHDMELGGYRYVTEDEDDGWVNAEKEAMCKKC